MNMKSILIILLIAALAVIPCYSLAEDSEIKPGDTIRVPIEISNNLGICSARIKIIYSKDVFLLLSQENGEVFSESSFTAGNTNSDECFAVWMGLNDIKKDGVLVNLNFKVLDTAKDGNYTINVSYDANDVFNLKEENIAVTLEQPSITIGTPGGTDETETTGGKTGSGGRKSSRTTIVTEQIKDGTFNNFTKKLTYENSFSDVAEQDWFYKNVKFGYEYGFINGKSENEFDSDGNITLAEAITLATRVRMIYYNETAVTETKDKWYMPFVEYALEKKIITKSDFDDYERSAMRKEVALLFANALPAECYERMNYVEKIVDMQEDDFYYSSVIKLYNSGILTGQDDKGTFAPNLNIKRCEAAAIINRVAEPSSRIEVTK